MIDLEYLITHPEYHLMCAALGRYDKDKDYMGPNGSWKAKFVPRTAWGIDLNIASYIHDWHYFKGGDEYDREEADKEFYFNMLEIIIDHEDSWWYGTNWFRKRMARRRAEKYYLAVAAFGDNHFNYINE